MTECTINLLLEGLFIYLFNVFVILFIYLFASVQPCKNLEPWSEVFEKLKVTVWLQKAKSQQSNLSPQYNN